MAKQQLGTLSQSNFTAANEKSSTLFQKICKLASFGLFNIAQKLGEIDKMYTEDQLIKLQTAVNSLHEKFINHVFVRRD